MNEQVKDLLIRWEKSGRIVKDCPGCQIYYKSDNPQYATSPPHKNSSYCKSGNRPHCSCDYCF